LSVISEDNQPTTDNRQHMKIYRFLHDTRPAIAVGDGPHLFRYDGPDALHLGARVDEPPHLIAGVQLLPPVAPSKIVAVGRNYADHAKELGNEAPAEPILFLKPPSALLPPNGTIVRPPQSQRVDFEGELAIVIGEGGTVLGYTCANDVTARDLQKRDVQFTRAKSFDTFLPLGPCIDTDANPNDLRLTTRVNGETRQDGRTSMMVFDCAFLIAYISSVMTLLPGDVILTGTPAGVGPLAAGDVVEVEIEGIGTLRNVVAQS
jgi:2-keto-4-pentenoate hydratase/2-oxohepta-3-ene-1,7-dioic acid hydratase in catechol pathway